MLYKRYKDCFGCTDRLAKSLPVKDCSAELVWLLTSPAQLAYQIELPFTHDGRLIESHFGFRTFGLSTICSFNRQLLIYCYRS